MTGGANGPVEAAQGPILVVDDDHKIVDLVTLYLRKEGYRVLQAFDGHTAIEIARAERPALAILDLMLPGVNGFVVCKTLQGEGPARLPVIMLTARSTEEDRLRGLDLGADDYLVKPFSPRELVARVRAVLRRTARDEEPPASPLAFGPLRIEVARHEVRVDGRRVDLTPTEYRLLLALARAPGHVFTRQQLIDRAFDQDFEGFERNIDVHVMNLRRKLALPADGGPAIKTVYGVGYRFEDGQGER